MESSLPELSSPVLIELHDALSELDRAHGTSLAELPARIEALRLRLRALPVDGRLGDHLTRLADSLEPTPEARERDVWLAYRARVQPAYEAVVHDLRSSDVDVPSLRPTNYARNALHLSSCIAGILVLELAHDPRVPIAIALAFAASGWSLEFLRRRSERVNAFCMRLFGRTAHPHEEKGINSATWYATALVPMALSRAVPPAIVGLLVLGIADPAAAIIGRRFGRIRLLHGRTLEGTAAFWASGSLASIAYLSLFHAELSFGRVALASAVGALAGAIAELVSKRLDDNLTIPLSSFAAAHVILAGLSHELLP